MDPERALAELPRPYRLAVILHRLGADDHLIVDCLDLEAPAVGLLLEIGLRKLQFLEDEPTPDIEQSHETQ